MTKIDIISGFLGAGKTTLIRKLLREAFQGEQVVLIENEFGEIGIDGGFLKEAGIEIREMNSGCICCSLVGDFGASLRGSAAASFLFRCPSGSGDSTAFSRNPSVGIWAERSSISISRSFPSSMASNDDDSHKIVPASEFTRFSIFIRRR